MSQCLQPIQNRVQFSHCLLCCQLDLQLLEGEKWYDLTFSKISIFIWTPVHFRIAHLVKCCVHRVNLSVSFFCTVTVLWKHRLAQSLANGLFCPMQSSSMSLHIFACLFWCWRRHLPLRWSSAADAAQRGWSYWTLSPRRIAAGVARSSTSDPPGRDAQLRSSSDAVCGKSLHCEAQILTWTSFIRDLSRILTPVSVSPDICAIKWIDKTPEWATVPFSLLRSVFVKVCLCSFLTNSPHDGACQRNICAARECTHWKSSCLYVGFDCPQLYLGWRAERPGSQAASSSPCNLVEKLTDTFSNKSSLSDYDHYPNRVRIQTWHEWWAVMTQKSTCIQTHLCDGISCEWGEEEMCQGVPVLPSYIVGGGDFTRCLTTCTYI